MTSSQTTSGPEEVLILQGSSSPMEFQLEHCFGAFDDHIFEGWMVLCQCQCTSSPPH